MNSSDTISTQKDEVIALRSIYNKEFKLHRPKNMKKKFEPPCISITVICSDSIIGVKKSVQLWFDCSSNYPITAPQILLKNSEGISLEIQNKLMDLLQEQSLELLGAPMIHYLVEYTRDYLVNINKPIHIEPVIKKEQLINSENKQREIKLQMLRERQNSAKKENYDEKYVEKCMDHSHNDSVLLKFEHCSDKVAFDVYRGVCDGNHRVLSINNGGRMVSSCFDGFYIAKGCSVKINQISLLNLSKKAIDILKNGFLRKLEEDFNFLYKLNHCNVLQYIAFRYQISENISNDERNFELEIQYVTSNHSGMTLTTQWDKHISSDVTFDNSSHLPISMIRLYLSQVLEGIRYLHEKNVTNIKLNIDSIYIDKDFNLKITNYYIGKRFEELKITKNKEENISNAKKGQKKIDIIRIGKLARKLFFHGFSNQEMKDDDIPTDLMSFIDCTRLNSPELFEHPFLRTQTPTKDVDEEHKTNLKTDDFSAWECFNKCSRIPTEFELIEKLGEGAFGDVIKVKNIYDSQFYAIKRVKLCAFKKRDSRRTMKEVQLLSSLNHENIVRYFASWSEDILQPDNVTEQSSSSLRDSPSLDNNLSLGISIHKHQVIDSSLFEMEELTNRINDGFFNNTCESKSGHFYNMISGSDSDADSIESNDEQSVREYHKSFITNNGYANDPSIRELQTQGKKIFKFLMIQMELCEGPCNTLDKYINEEQLYRNEKYIWKFIREIVSGLEHIHSKNMIHRDLKPTNIFIDHQMKVKIGDLGLAYSFDAKSLDANPNLLLDNNIVSSEKGPVGTIMYICPEMLSQKPYNNKADMYSLGIIVFEMCHPPFSTASERYEILRLVREPGIVFPPENEFKMKDKFKQLISLLLNHDPSKRPNAFELLRSNIIPPPEAREMELQQRLKEITKDSSSKMYKLLLNNMFNHTSAKIGGYELPLLYQSPFKYYISNTQSTLLNNYHKKPLQQIDEGDYTFFTTKRRTIRFVESVFVSHGAVEFTAPILTPKSAWKESQAFTLLDSEGIVVNLPTNLRDNFAHFLLNNDICNSRRFAIDRIYHQQEYRRDHPKELLEAVFDIVSDYKSDNTSVETIYILHEIFSKLFSQEHVSLKLEINNTEIFFNIMGYYRIPEDIQSRIFSWVDDKPDSVVTYMDSDEFKQATSLSDSQTAHLKSILTYSGRIEDLEKFLKIYFNKARENLNCKAISNAFNELLSIVQSLDRFESNLCFDVFVRPIFVPKQHFYQGFVFQLLFEIQDRFIDIVKQAGQTNTKMIVRYLKSINKVCLGGDYSNFLMKARRQSVSEEVDVIRYVSTVGFSIDMSTVIHSVYSIEQLKLTISGKYSMNSAIDVVVQYEQLFDKKCRDILSSLWKLGIPTVLYDKDDEVENYVFQNKIGFLVEFFKSGENRLSSEERIIVMKNDCNGIGLEQVSNEDCKTIDKAIDVLLKEHKKNDTSQFKFKGECVYPYHKQLSESSTTESNPEIDPKKNLNLKSELSVGRYTYVFVTVKENKQNRLDLKYLVETNRQVQSVRAKNYDFDMSYIQMLLNLNSRLININKWFQSKFPSQLYIILVELSYDKCFDVTEEVSQKNLKDATKLTKIISKIESSVNYSMNTEKHWKDIISRLWKQIQEASKDKMYKLLIYSHIDDNLLFVDIK